MLRVLTADFVRHFKMCSDDEEVFSEDSLEDYSGSDIFSEAESSELLL